MKKQFFIACTAIFLGITLQTKAQDNVAINRPMGNEGLKSVSEARNIALTNTLMPLALGMGSVLIFDNKTIETTGAIMTVYGIVMGPSTGNFYAQDYGRGTAGFVARSVGAYLLANASNEIFGDDFANALNVDNKPVSLTDTKILIGEILVLGSAVYNVLSSKASVEEYNNNKRKFSMSVTPAVVRDEVTPMLTAKIRL